MGKILKTLKKDQSYPKRCGHLSGKVLIKKTEMLGKIHAALDARKSEETLIVARTDAIAVEGFQGALDRAEHFLDAGADIIFVEAPKSIDPEPAQYKCAETIDCVDSRLRSALLSVKILHGLGAGFKVFPIAVKS